MKRKSTFRLFSLVLTLSLVFTGFIGIDEANAAYNSQTVVIYEGFDNGTTAPQGWEFTGINSLYTDIYGTKAPALKFDNTGDRVATMDLVNPSLITFSIQGQNTDDNSYLKVEKFIINHWTLIEDVKPIPKVKTQLGYALNDNVTKVRFTYFKFTGDLAFDDVAVVADPVPVSLLVLNKTADTITVGNTTTLTSTIYPDFATNKTLIWETSNPNVAIVSNGLVRGMSQGDAVIIVKSAANPDVKAECIIHVTSDGITEIKNLRVDTDNDGFPDFYKSATPLTIKGRISADFRTSTVNQLTNTIYIQDATGGICVIGSTNYLTPGKEVQVTGKVTFDSYEAKFHATNIVITNNSIKQVVPTELSTKDSMLEANEGMLVKIQGKVTRINGTEIFVSDKADGSDEARVTGANNYLTVVNSVNTLTAVKVGDTLNITGIAAQYASGHKIMVRSIDDVKLVTSTPSNPDQPNNPVSAVRLNKSSIVIKAGKFEYVNILTVPGNADVRNIKLECVTSGQTPIVTLTADKKNPRLLKLVPNTTVYYLTQKLYVVVTVNNKEYKLQIEVTIDNAKTQTKKPAAAPTVINGKK